ncbi:hypothetical protein QC761_0062550 [Podospora bellae-mahoneyi]|uniref:Uncharacterized protein n=1 Tax=Podospora bellae-mahoneyi TaxID=2093777 RepID=A0ABR0FG31_9PEZI|nr:hypothetical protein QC761_0062550 [Podospora bellae-mahoneyi]
MAAFATDSYVSWDDFLRIRSSQDEQLVSQLTKIRQDSNQATQRLDQIAQRLNRLQGEFNTRFDHLELENKRSQARFYNYTLKNPALRIAPIPTYHPTQGILEPDPTLFPRHAKDFYALRSPSNARHRNMLSYLVIFYDIQLFAPDEDEDEDGDEARPEDVDSEATVDRRAVELLETILGLNEDNFIRFRERAAELRVRPAPSAVKRSQPLAQRGEEAETRRPILELRPHVPAQHESSSEMSDKAQMGWRVGTRSTPPSQRVTVNNLQAAVAAAARAGQPAGVPAEPPRPGSGGSDSTRPFTTPQKR